MKIIGKTLEGDLIIQVSQAEWDGLQDGVRPKTRNFLQAEIGKYLLDNLDGFSVKGFNSIEKAFYYAPLDDSFQSLRDIADGTVKVRGIGSNLKAKLKKLLDALPPTEVK